MYYSLSSLSRIVTDAVELLRAAESEAVSSTTVNLSSDSSSPLSTSVMVTHCVSPVLAAGPNSSVCDSTGT